MLADELSLFPLRTLFFFVELIRLILSILLISRIMILFYFLRLLHRLHNIFEHI